MQIFREMFLIKKKKKKKRRRRIFGNWTREKFSPQILKLYKFSVSDFRLICVYTCKVDKIFLYHWMILPTLISKRGLFSQVEGKHIRIPSI